MTEDEIYEKQTRIYKKIAKLGTELDALRKEAPAECTHKYTEPYLFNTDNGYGRLGCSEGAVCRVCRARNPYPESSTHWMTHEEWLSSD